MKTSNKYLSETSRDVTSKEAIAWLENSLESTKQLQFQKQHEQIAFILHQMYMLFPEV